jgi:hypothetical protein
MYFDAMKYDVMPLEATPNSYSLISYNRQWHGQTHEFLWWKRYKLHLIRGYEMMCAKRNKVAALYLKVFYHLNNGHVIKMNLYRRKKAAFNTYVHVFLVI